MIEQERLIAAPFPGLRPFEMSENFVFFGRDGQSDEVLDKLSSAKFVAIVGTSGSGKSSLVRAGLLPALLSGHMPSAGSNWRIAVFRPGNSPIKNMAAALNAPDVFGTTDTNQGEERLTNIERTLRRSSLGLLEVVSNSRMNSNENLLLLVDQFEELFRFKQGRSDEHPEDEAAAFVKLLLEARQAGKQDQQWLPIYVILTMRSDYLGHCANFWGLPEAINDGQYLIPRMTDDDRREAITGPAIIGGGRISSPLLNRLLNDAGEDPARLPILQHTLMRTWNYWKSLDKPDAPIDLVHYEKIGTMTHALSIHADEAYLELSPTLRIVAEKVFKALTEKEADRRVRRPATIGDISASAEASDDEVKQVVETFRREGRSFLMPPVSVELTSDTLIDISHESLIGGWERLKQWVEEEAEAAWQYQRLAQTAALFPEKEDFLRGPALQINLKWRDTNQPSRAWALRYHAGFDKAIEYLDLSKANHEAEIAAKERQRKEEIERDLRHAEAIAGEQKRRVTQLRWGVLVLAMLLLGMFGVTVYASYQKRTADKQKKVAEEALVQVEQEQKKTKEALEKAQLQQRRAEQEQRRAEQEQGRAEVEQRRAENALHKANEAQQDAEVQRDNAQAQKKLADIATTTARDEASKAVTARLLASEALAQQQETNKELVEQKKRADEQLKRAEAFLAEISEIDRSAPYFAAVMRGGHTKDVNRVTFSPDGRLVLTADADGVGGVWDALTGAPTKILPDGNEKNPTPVTMSNKGNLILYGEDFRSDLTGYILDAKTGKIASTIAGWAPNMVANAVFSKDETIVVGHDREDQSMSLVNVKSGEEIRTFGAGYFNTIQSFALSSNNKRIATARTDAYAQLWNVDTGAVVAELRHLDEVKSVAFSPNSKFVVTASKDGTASVWDAETGSFLTRLAGHAGPVNTAVFDPAGDFILTTSGKVAYLWRSKVAGSWAEPSEDSPHTMKGHTDDLTQAIFSPDPEGTWIATTSRDRTAQLWDAVKLKTPYTESKIEGDPTRTNVAVFRGHIKAVTSAAFSPDSKSLLTGSEDRTARVWNLKTLGAFAVENVSVRTEPDRYSGKCPVTVKFTATISVVGRSGTVKYKFVRSDGTESLPQDLVFDAPGSREVTDTGDVSRTGEVAVQILEPVSKRSNKALFTVSCEQASIAAPGLTFAQLREIIPTATEQNIALYLPYIEAAMKEYGINTSLRQAAFLAEVAHNTAALKTLEEFGSDDFLEKRYGQRKDLGNFETGDGARYKGRGPFGLVGRSNYQALGELLGVDLVKEPELAATPKVAFRAAALYWYKNGFNELADKGDFDDIDEKISGNDTTSKSVKDYFNRAKIVLSR